ncbi:MAG TPA: hypothetical protein VMF89_02905, partial [Polyangiales bacterium]|nr:hypothetical protein [Polyangiales bacterium]
AFRARLTERYSLADQTWIANHCTGYPDECSRLDLLELLWLKSHNDAAAYGFEQSVKRLEEDRAIAREERRDRRWRRAFLGIAAGALVRSSRRGD